MHELKKTMSTPHYRPPTVDNIIMDRTPSSAIAVDAALVKHDTDTVDFPSDIRWPTVRTQHHQHYLSIIIKIR